MRQLHFGNLATGFIFDYCDLALQLRAAAQRLAKGTELFNWQQHGPAMNNSMTAGAQSAFDICRAALDAPRPVSLDSLNRVHDAMRDALAKMCVLDTAYTAQGVMEGTLKPRWRKGKPTAQLMLVLPAANGRRPVKYIGSKPHKVGDAKLKTARYKARTRLRVRMAEFQRHHDGLLAKAKVLNAQAFRLLADLEIAINSAYAEAKQLENEEYATTDSSSIA